MNQWSYVREETGPDRASGFGTRTLSADDVVDHRTPALPDDVVFGASCTFVDAAGVRSAATTVNGTGVTYRMFDRILDVIDRTPQWQMRQMPRPATVRVGLLSAMEEVIRRGGTNPTVLKALPPVTYVFDGTFYSLSVRDARDVGPVQVGGTGFERLIRVDFAIVNQTTRIVTRFVAMFQPDEVASLPVQVVFQPNFWIRVELRLDDGADAPADPAADAATLARIRAMCARAVDRNQPARARAPSASRN
jgi:hypothetical protein